jgi:hypothetical protein
LCGSIFSDGLMRRKGKGSAPAFYRGPGRRDGFMRGLVSVDVKPLKIVVQRHG